MVAVEVGRGVVLGRENGLCKDSEMIKRKKVKSTSRFLVWMIVIQ